MIKPTAQQEEYQKKIKEIILTHFNDEGTDREESYKSNLTPRQIFSAGENLLNELKAKYPEANWERSEDNPNCVACAWEAGWCAQTLSNMMSEDCVGDWTEYRRYESCAFLIDYQEATILYATEYQTWFRVEGDDRTYLLQLEENKLYVRMPEGDLKLVTALAEPYQANTWERIVRNRMREATELLNAIK